MLLPGVQCILELVFRTSVPKRKHFGTIFCILRYLLREPGALLNDWIAAGPFIAGSNTAAVATLHPDEMDKMIPGPNRRVKEILWTAAAAGRAEWYFNNIRVRLRISSSRHALMPSGTTSNESLHAEINNWYSGIATV